MEVMLGLVAIAFAFFLLAFKLDDKHAVIKVLALFFGILSLLVITNHIMAQEQYCEIVPVNETISQGGNHTQYTYDRVCYTYPRQTGTIAFKLINYFIRIVMIYAFVFAIYWIFMIQGIDLLDKVRELFKK